MASPLQQQEQPSQQPAPPPFERLPGEIDFLNIQSLETADSIVLLFPCEDDNEPLFTSMYVTNFRLLLAPQRAGRTIPVIDVPLMLLQSWKPGRHSTVGPADAAKRRTDRQTIEYFVIELVTKNLWNFRVGFPDERSFTTARKVLDGLRPTHLTMLPAYDLGKAQLKAWGPNGECKDLGWNFYDVDAELARQISIDPQSPVPGIEELEKCGVGVDLRNWFRTTTLGQNDNHFGKSPTYPFKIIVPNAASEKLLKQALECRSRARIPAISFINLATGGCLARASQPLKNKNCYADGRLLQYLIGTFTPASAKPRDEDVVGSPDRPMALPTPNGMSASSFASAQAGNATSSSSATGGPNAVTGRPSSAVLPPPSLMDDGGSGSSFSSAPVSKVFAPPSLVDPPSSPQRAAAPPLSSPGSVVASAGGSAFASISTPSSVTSSPARGGNGGMVGRTAFVPQRFINAVDCRPKAAAMGNEAMGGGYESGPHYELCRVKFYSIDNIHGVTASFNKLKALLTAHNGQLPKGDFYSQWHETMWMVHIQRVLVCSKEIAEMLMRGESAIVHCTDGWDRTSQCTSLAMLMLDPYYRTIRGFGVLIEKEWCSFGHKFAERNMHEIRGDTYCQVDTGLTASDVESQQDMKQHKQQPSPIFFQWLDCVFQVIRQFPSQFEFTSQFLQFLNRSCYSCHYGTFLTNTAKERVFEGVKLKTISLWTHVEQIVADERAGLRPLCFVNPTFDAETTLKYIKKEVNCGILPLIPCTSSKRLVLWEENYLQFDADTWTTELGSLGAPPRGSAPTPCPLHAPLQEYMDGWAAEALRRREADVAHMQDVLKRLMVQARPPQTTSEKMQRDPNAKTCWICQTKFGWFVNREYCDECNVALCGKCFVETAQGRRVCKNCLDMLSTGD